MRFFYTCAFALFTLLAAAQTGKGKAVITVLAEQKTPVEGATVELLRSKDSTLVKTAVTDKAGVAEIENLPAASYVVRTTAVGLATTYSPRLSDKGK